MRNFKVEHFFSSKDTFYEKGCLSCSSNITSLTGWSKLKLRTTKSSRILDLFCHNKFTLDRKANWWYGWWTYCPSRNSADWPTYLTQKLVSLKFQVVHWLFPLGSIFPGNLTQELRSLSSMLVCWCKNSCCSVHGPMRLGYLNGSDAEMWSKRAMALMCCQCKTWLLILCLIFLLELIRIGSEENSRRNEFY